MSSRLVFDCDRCEEKDVGEDSGVSFFHRRQMDAAGSSESCYFTGHLCPKCKSALIDSMGQELSLENREAVARRFKLHSS